MSILLYVVTWKKRICYVSWVVLLCLLSITSQAQVAQWAQAQEGTGYMRTYQVATDAAGNVYSCGDMSGTVNFHGTGGTSYTFNATATGQDGFVCAHNSTGALLWVVPFTGTYIELVEGIDVDATGVYVTGRLSSTTSTLISTNGSNISLSALSAGSATSNIDGFVARISLSGVPQWAERFGGTNGTGDVGRKVGVDAAGKVYVSGDTRSIGNMTLGSGTNTVTFPARGVSGADGISFVACYDQTAGLPVLSWVTTVEASLSNLLYEQDMDVLPNGNNYTIGTWTNGTLNVYRRLPGGTTTTLGSGLLSDSNSSNWGIYVLGLDASGQLLFVEKAGTEEFHESGFSAGSLVSGNVTLTAHDDQNIYIAMGGNVFASATHTVTFGSTTFTSSVSNSDILMAKYNPQLSGTARWVWAARYGVSTSSEGTMDVDTDPSGNIYLTGRTAAGNTGFSFGNGVSLAADSRGYIASFDQAGTARWAQRIGVNAASVSATSFVPAGIATSGCAVYLGGYYTLTNPSPLVDFGNGITVTGTANLTTGFLMRSELSYAGPDQTLACGTTSAVLAGNTLSSTSTGIWSVVSGSGTFSSASSPTATASGLAPGSNVFRWTASSSVGCSDYDDVSITNPAPAVPSAGSNGSVCTGTTINLTASAAGATSYRWTGPNSFTSSLQNPTIANATSAHAGTYSVVAITGSCTTAVAYTNVTVKQAPGTPTAGSNSPRCTGNTISLTGTATGAASYSWTGPNGFTSSLQNPSVSSATSANSGNYILTVTSASGCQLAATVAVTVANTFANAEGSCHNGTVSLQGYPDSMAAYSWSGPFVGTKSGQTPVITSGASGTYTLTVTDAYGCTAATTTAVTCAPAPVCCESAVSIAASNAVYMTGVKAGSYGSGQTSIFLRKYDMTGALAWEKEYTSGTGNTDRPLGIAADNANVYITGLSQASGSNQTALTLKYNSSGTLQWATQHSSIDGTTAHARGSQIAVDASGNVFVAGAISSAAWTTGSDSAYVRNRLLTLKFNASGTKQWANVYVDTTNRYFANGAVLVSDSAFYVTTARDGGIGTSKDYATFKINYSGTRLWKATYNGPGNGNDIPAGVAVFGDAVLVTGASVGATADRDYATIRYRNSDGAMLWAQRYNSTGNGDDAAAAIALDSNYVYVTGTSANDFLTAKYDRGSGALRWINRFGSTDSVSTAYNKATAIIARGSRQVLVTGFGYNDIQGLSNITTIEIENSDPETAGLIKRKYIQSTGLMQSVFNSTYLQSNMVLDANDNAWVLFGEAYNTSRQYSLLRYQNQGALIQRNATDVYYNQNLLARSVLSLTNDPAFVALVRRTATAENGYTVRMDYLAANTPNFLQKASASLLNAGGNEDDVSALESIYKGYQIEGISIKPAIYVPYYNTEQFNLPCWDGNKPEYVIGMTDANSMANIPSWSINAENAIDEHVSNLEGGANMQSTLSHGSWFSTIVTTQGGIPESVPETAFISCRTWCTTRTNECPGNCDQDDYSCKNRCKDKSTNCYSGCNNAGMVGAVAGWVFTF